ncbi:MAG TPA: polyphenol oxidase family protein, partial [Jiangellaceae bacterium]|nr:polyphenol oxidase family protein [Jiangellaceae bacterium]
LYMNQVHGADVAVVDGPRAGAVPAVDAMVTTRAGLGLAVLVADCVPVVLADPRAGVLAVAHAGRTGLVAGVVPSVVRAMRANGARSITATLGPSVCGSCYEVPDDMRADVAGIVPEAWAHTRVGTPALDVAAGVAAQLRAEGVAVANVGECTMENPDFYSFRRDHRTGRFAGLVWMT